jgi:hypothetical protein
MRRTTTALLAAACLALGGCSSGGEPTKTVTATVTASPSLSKAEAKAACVDAWLALMTADGYDPEAEPETPGECEGLSGQAGMYAEALQARNQANRDEIAECVDDPSCTSVPIP